MEKANTKVYTIFISYTKADQKIADEVNVLINQSFGGKVRAWLASEELKSGDAWKEEIKKNLDNCDAIVSLFTPYSKNKPWLFVEWSVFWVANRDVHIFLADGLTTADLIAPMQDIQYVTITSEEAIEGFLNRLSKAAGLRTTNYDFVDDYLVQIKSVLQLQEQEAARNSFEKYIDIKTELPNDDNEKEQVATYFINGKDLSTFKRIYARIANDRNKTSLVKKLVAKGEIATAVAAAIDLRIPENQTDILLLLMQENVAAKSFYALIDNISKKNQPQLKYPLNHLIDHNQVDNPLFTKILSYATHTITLHKVATYLIEHDKLSSAAFRKVAQTIIENNRAESRKLAEDLIEGNLEETKEFDLLIRGTAEGNQMEGGKLMIYLLQFNKALYCKYKAQNIITNLHALKRMEEAEKEYGSCD